MSFTINFDPKTQPMSCLLRDYYFPRIEAAADEPARVAALVETMQQVIIAVAMLELQINTDMPRPEYGPMNEYEQAGEYQIPMREIPDEMRSPVSVRLRKVEERLDAAGL